MGYNVHKNNIFRIPKETKKLFIKMDANRKKQDEKEEKILDSVCYLINGSKKVTDTICYQNLLEHGIQMFDEEMEIHIDLEKIESNIRYMLFALSVFEPEDRLLSVENQGDYISDFNIIFRIYDEDTKKEICHFIPDNKEEKTGIYLGNLEKTYSSWNFRAVEESMNGNIVEIRNAITNLKHLSQYINKK